MRSLMFRFGNLPHQLLIVTIGLTGVVWNTIR
jgi:hypothetical protein